ncbi:MAG: methyltransferase domain-containing protein [Deltaproteobacteria bacterium]|nr:methyltransferase domain-containing protein [Deltaproteobacteria bacterium]MBW2082483.1 methyltransferase domain-containing protein [Deltaproteobacteria bacterium]
MFDLNGFKEKFRPNITEIGVGGRKFKFYTPSDLELLLDDDVSMHNFPLWARIWEPSVVLALHMSTIQPDPNKTCLEIGAGLGVAGIVAACFGHRITLTEYDPDALEFAKANALLNNCEHIEISRLDWHYPDIEGKFDIIFGSEVVYRKEDYESLERLFNRYLTPRGVIILAEGLRRSSMEFLQRMSDRYQIKARKKVLRGNKEEIHLLLCEMRPT